MQQQYSVMKKLNTPNIPNYTPGRRGRRTRGSTRGKWASVNKSPSSSDEGLDSEADIGSDMSEDLNDGYDVESRTADDSQMVGDDPALDDETSVEMVPPPLLPSRSVVEPARSSVSKRATFPNLLGLAGSAPSVPDNKPVNPDPPKRNAEVTDSESRSSSHLSKRRKYSTEPSETYNSMLSDPSTGLKALNDGLKLNGMIFYPDAIAKASENFRNMSIAYVAEKASRKETFEAALKRATRRANDADHKLQDASQEFADKLKAESEANDKTQETLRAENESLKAENASLVISEAASREALKTASHSPSLQNSLLEKEAQLALFDQLRSQVNGEIEKLTALHASAMEKSDAMHYWQKRVSDSVDKFNNDLEDMGMKTIKRCGTEIQGELRSMLASDVKATESLREVGKGIATFLDVFTGAKEASDRAGEQMAANDDLMTDANPTTAPSESKGSEKEAAAKLRGGEMTASTVKVNSDSSPTKENGESMQAPKHVRERFTDEPVGETRMGSKTSGSIPSGMKQLLA
ncbi:hypothetical protein MMC07_006631 [Pseudocyphellaria aurata]|nr:hypothetical protein [Pseudocyphellaria aurata]